jgi:2,3-dihydroxybiphenyl 1,2-dioxygenase
MIRGLGYLIFEVSDPDRWERFLVDLLGLELTAEAGPLRRFRMDDWEVRLLLCPGPSDDLAGVGWEARDPAALVELEGRLKNAGIPWTAGSASECERRAVERFVRFTDPGGIPTEVFYGPALSTSPLRSRTVSHGFVTGTQGMGHVVLSSRSLDESLRFYTDLLGFRETDRIRFGPSQARFEAVFLHVNPRHHSLALAAGLPFPKRLHHFMIELQDLDDLGRTLDRFLETGTPITRGLGRHPNDRMLSFYGRTPSGFEVEVGWNGRRLGENEPLHRVYGAISEWGHRPSETPGS